MLKNWYNKTCSLETLRIGVMAAQQTLTLLVEVRGIWSFIGVWLSLVERYVRDVEVAGSNPVTPIFSCKNIGYNHMKKRITAFSKAMILIFLYYGKVYVKNVSCQKLVVLIE